MQGELKASAREIPGASGRDQDELGDDDEPAPISSRDPRVSEPPRSTRALQHLLRQVDSPAREFYDRHVAGSLLHQYIRSEIVGPLRMLTIHSLLEKPSFRRDPRRLQGLLSILEEYKRLTMTKLEAMDMPEDKRKFIVGNVLQKIVKYSGSLYNWQDNPDIHPEQRALLVEEAALPLVLDIMDQNFNEPSVDRPKESLNQLAESLVTLTRRMALSGALKKGRGEIVLKWCKLNILRTTQAYVDPSGRRCLPAADLEALAIIKLRAVIFNILLDDLADDVQDPRKFAVFCRIPYPDPGIIGPVSEERHEALREELPEPWVDYLDLAVLAWNSCLQQLLSLVGQEVFARHAPQLKRDYDDILGSMEYSLRLNTTSDMDREIVEDTGMILAHNMNMMAFETMDRMALDRAAPDVGAALDGDPELYAAIREVNLLLQHNGQIGNSTATLDAEIDENCAANEVVAIARQQPGGAEISGLYKRRREAIRWRDMDTYTRLGAMIQDVIATTNARSIYFRKWVENKDRIRRIVREHPAIEGVIDVPATLDAHDKLLLMSWVYRGDI